MGTREVDRHIVQTKEWERKLQGLQSSIKMMTGELNGLRGENERLEADVDTLRKELHEASLTFDKSSQEVDRLQRTIFYHRKELGSESRQRGDVQQDLRATKAAQTLMINRVDQIDKRSRALRTSVQ